MPPRTRSRRRTELKVVFDTNVLFTGSESDLLNQDTQRLILESRQLSDPLLTWCIPRVVILERQYQMKLRALALLPAIAKLERLLGHNLNITEQIVAARITDAIDAQLESFGLVVLDPDYEAIQWERVVLDAAARNPPFEPGEKEKGFRDALILETFVQLVGSSPSTAQICRIVLVTDDDLLSRSAASRTSSSTNVMCLSGLNDLAGLINTLASQVPEAYVAELEPKAEAYFYAAGDTACLFIKYDIRKTIVDRYSAELERVPPGADMRTNRNWQISAPRFLKKDRQRISWASRISIEAEAHKYPRQGIFFTTSKLDAPPASAWTTFGSTGLTPLVPGSSDIFAGTSRPGSDTALWSAYSSNVQGASGFGSTAFPYATTTVHSRGLTIFEVTWSISVDTSKRFTHPRIDSIECSGTTWE